ncbi:MAG: HAD-IA family hydrolase [Planctomycetota bacterium]
MTPPRIICFDLGGVVVRICRSWQEACDRAGIPTNGRTDPSHLESCLHATMLYMAGQIDCEALWSSISEATGGDYAPDEVEAVHRVWVLDDYPGIADLIAQINASPALTSACLSNTNHAHWQPLVSGDAPSEAILRIEHKLVSHEMKAVKPQEQIYRDAERLLAAAPHELLFFDDTPENVEMARVLGWRAEHIDHAGDTAAQVTAHLKSHGVEL